jgi:hypothetical protein
MRRFSRSTAQPAGRMSQLATHARPFARRHLFLLGHMRSYSSVLSHILGSHPQIDGYCETHIKYRTRLDLWRLHHRVRQLCLRFLVCSHTQELSDDQPGVVG